MKSQGFLLAFIVIGIALIALVYNFSLTLRKTRDVSAELSKLYNKILDMFSSEVLLALRFNQTNYSYNIKNLIDIGKSLYQAKTFSFIGNYKNGRFNITLINYFDQDIIVEIWLNNSNKTTLVKQNNINNTFFDLEAGLYNLTFKYDNSKYSKNINFDSSKNNFYIYVDSFFERESLLIRKVKEDFFVT